MLIGYAVSLPKIKIWIYKLTFQKKTDCSKIFPDKLSGINKQGPGIDDALSHLRSGDTFLFNFTQ